MSLVLGCPVWHQLPPKEQLFPGLEVLVGGGGGGGQCYVPSPVNGVVQTPSSFLNPNPPFFCLCRCVSVCACSRVCVCMCLCLSGSTIVREPSVPGAKQGPRVSGGEGRGGPPTADTWSHTCERQGHAASGERLRRGEPLLTLPGFQVAELGRNGIRCRALGPARGQVRGVGVLLWAQPHGGPGTHTAPGPGRGFLPCVCSRRNLAHLAVGDEVSDFGEIGVFLLV